MVVFGGVKMFGCMVDGCFWWCVGVRLIVVMECVNVWLITLKGLSALTSANYMNE